MKIFSSAKTQKLKNSKTQKLKNLNINERLEELGPSKYLEPEAL